MQWIVAKPMVRVIKYFDKSDSSTLRLRSVQARSEPTNARPFHTSTPLSTKHKS
jgi:hypothetical protein